MADPESSTSKPGRRIPPLVWIVLAALVAWVVLMMVQRGGAHRTPDGGEMPMAEQGPSTMPPAPAEGTTPATPGSVSNPPQ